MEALVQKRDRIKAKIVRIEAFVSNPANINKVDANELAIRETMLIKTFDDYNNVQDKLEAKDESESEDREFMEEQYISIHCKLKNMIQVGIVNASATNGVGATQNNLSANVENHQQPAPRKVNLPNLNIPVFSGKYEDWKSFSDLFTALIDKDTQLSNAQKLLYLKSVVKYEPFSLISNLQITDDNYKIALGLLKDRYDNKMVIINSHIRAIVEANIVKGGSSSLRDFITQIKQNVSALEALSVPVKAWDLILIFLISHKLDYHTHRAFELERDSSAMPTLSELLGFLEKRCLVQESVSHMDQNKNRYGKATHFSTQSLTSVTHNKDMNRGRLNDCPFCKSQDHNIYKCLKFKNLQVSDRKDFVTKNRFCFNCFGKKHLVTQCPSDWRCRNCSGKHHTLLHEERSIGSQTYKSTNVQIKPIQNNENVEATASSSYVCYNNNDSRGNLNETQNTQCLMSNHNKKQILLATAQVTVISENGNDLKCRALLDPCSQSSFATSNIIKKMGLRVHKTNVQVTGIGNRSTQVTHVAKITIKCNNGTDDEITVSCGILNKITGSLPQITIDKEALNIPSNLKLADKDFCIPSQIDILIGADIYYEIIEAGIIKFGKDMPVLQNSKIGWFIGGPVPSRETSVTNLSVLCCQTHQNINEFIPKFWQLEEVNSNHCLSKDDKLCERIFCSSTTHTQNGSFQVDIPLRNSDDHLMLGNSFTLASKRFNSLERRLTNDKKLYSEYKGFIDEYVSLGHGRYIPLDLSKPELPQRCFLPHHCVIREESSSTRLRVVFDASMKTSSGLSLNDIMLKGFTVQPELFDILCRFREFKFVLIADIRKMYRMVRVNPKQCFLQNILWRDNPRENLKCIELQTLTYGTKSAPYLATRCLKKLAEDESESFPLASAAILSQCYVDDILCGAHDKKEVIELKKQLTKMLGSANFMLHKWHSNDESLLQSTSDATKIVDINSSEGKFSKVLGLSWSSHSDRFKFSLPSLVKSQNYTKRQVLSYIAQMFDPMGLIGPVIVIAKGIMQQIWMCKLNWDDQLPQDLKKKWETFAKDIPKLSQLSVPRCLYCDINIVEVQLHGFSDASLKAYGACIYLRALYSNNRITSNLLCSKSRISPLKTVSLPRLELCGALLLSRLADRIVGIMSRKCNKVVLWTDSKIVLAWIKSPPTRWTTFVANRVSEIQELTTNYQWKHVISSENPADCVSRGLNPSDILLTTQWWHGPKMLVNVTFNLQDENCPDLSVNSIPEQRKVVVQSTVAVDSTSIFSTFSSFSRLQRSIAYCLRFVKNAKPGSTRRTNSLSIEELNESLLKIFICVQREWFSNEISQLSKNQDIYKGPIANLNPFVDDKGLLRVGGRLANADINYEQKHPILLPPKNHVVRLMLRYEHMRLQHAGPQTVLANVRLRYWPLHGMRETKHIIKNCVTCHRFKAAVANQIMGALPSDRVNITRPFSKVGVDFGGPLFIKNSNLRHAKVSKCYISVFVCMVTKAVHIELVSSLSTESFLLTLKRFIARRGNPSKIFSDNATNFKGARNQLRELYLFFKQKSTLQSIYSFLSQGEIEWQFIPPNSPHWGGLWEAAIKSTKHHIRRSVGNNNFTFEELSTVLAQIEAILNSRPLWPMSDDPTDFKCLTPGHFLVGAPLTSYPEKNLSDIPLSRLKFWEKCSKAQQQFWKRWSVEYLNQLQNRPKWHKVFPNLKENMVVLVKEDNLPPLQWVLGRIIEGIPGADKRVRVAKIRTKNGIFTRPITKLCPLPFNAWGEDVEV